LELQTALADQAAAAQVNAKLLQRMERMAITDGLTGLNNHRQFQASFAAQLARAERYKRKLALIFADIDHFKQVNDVHGHLVGDQVLRRIAAILQGSARCTDVVARYGGEEFAVLMEETGVQGACCIAERIRKAVEKEIFHDDRGVFRATLSLGVAAFPLHGATKERLIACADQALYQAKRSGRNQTLVFDAKATEAPGIFP
ncbi:MAG: GGDEF domain-containing protein, partial [Cytophagaceae bacterium]